MKIKFLLFVKKAAALVATKSLLSPVILELILATILLSLPSLAWAQSAANSGQIAGEVIDPSSATVAGVEVSVRNVDTNQRRVVTTDQAGRYAVGPVPIGTYEVT